MANSSSSAAVAALLLCFTIILSHNVPTADAALVDCVKTWTLADVVDAPKDVIAVSTDTFRTVFVTLLPDLIVISAADCLVGNLKNPILKVTPNLLGLLKPVDIPLINLRGEVYFTTSDPILFAAGFKFRLTIGN